MASSTHHDRSAAVQTAIRLLAASGRHPIHRTKIPTAHPSGRPPAEHVIKMLAQHVTATHIKPKSTPTVNIRHSTIHPGKALVLRKVKSIHLGS